MKTQFYPIASKLRNLIALLLTLFMIGRTCAQDHVISGDALTYNWFNSYPGTVVNGNLTIGGGAFNLYALGDSFWANLTTVTGNLIITSAANLGDLNGLQHLTSVGGSVIIENNINLNNIASLSNLQSIGGDLIIQNNNALGSLTGLENVVSIGGSIFVLNNAAICCFSVNTHWALQSVQNITVSGNQNMTQIFPFTNLTSLNDITITNNASISFFAAFPALQSAGIITIQENANLATIAGFDALQTVTWFYVRTNTSLTSVGFPALTSVNYFEIRFNSNLSLCCWATELINLSQLTPAIDNNGPGCESLAVVNAPPTLDMCVPNETVNTTANTCENVYSMRLPIAADNCDFLSQEVKITIGDGSIWHDGPYGGGGSSFNYILKPGLNTFEFVATDLNGNKATCNSVITVEDNELPAPPANYPNEFFLEADSDCTGTLSITAEGFTDNCGVDSYEIEISGGPMAPINALLNSGNSANFDLEIGNYTYSLTVFDVNGLSYVVNTPVRVADGSAPEWIPTNLVKVVEIECGEVSIQDALTANTPTATDCTGADVLIDGTFPSTTSCGLEEVRYTFITRDGFGATNPEIYDLTIREIDTKAPVLDGIPSDMTIGCNDPIPSLANVTAIDACDGDISNLITLSAIPSMGVCDVGEIAQTIAYMISVEDACGNVTTVPWNVTIVSDFSFQLSEDVNLCGETFYILNPGNLGTQYTWSDGSTSQAITVVSSGTYRLTVTTNNGCCYSDEISVNLGVAPVISAEGGVISCSTGNTQLTGASDIANASFAWVGPGGFTSSEQNPLVADAGEYTLTVTSPIGCAATATAMVTGGSDLPDVSATGGIVTCDETSATIMGSSETADVTFSWSGPDNFASSSQDNTVETPGIYTLVVTSSNGCTATASAEIIDNQSGPEISISASDLNCLNPISFVSLETTDEIISYEWFGPSNFGSNGAQPILEMAGTYMLTVTGSNGCTSVSELSISEDFQAPDITTVGAEISCTSNSVMISATSQTENVSYSWTGPDGFGSNAQNPTVTQPGTYTVTVSGENGCTAIEVAEVNSDSDLPNVSATGGNIDCNNESVVLQGSTTTEGAVIGWTGPGGFTSDQAMNTVTTVGVYKFTVVAPSGCEAFKEVEVLVDNKNPDIVLFQGDVDCENSTRAFSLITDATDGAFEWTGPDAFTSSEQNPSFSLAGMYSVKITGTNGCITEGSISVEEDIAFDVQLEVTENAAEAQVTGGTGPFTFVWDDALGEATIAGLTIGSHELKVVDGLGCIKTLVFEVMTLGVDDLSTNYEIELFPNPAQDVLNLEIRGLDANTMNIQVIDISGTMIRSKKLKNNTEQNVHMDVSVLPQGYYLLSIQSKNIHITKKFFKM